MSANDSSHQDSKNQWEGPQAVIFTHFHGLKFKDDEYFASNKQSYIKKYTQIIKSYLKCNNNDYLISVVYGYVDAGFQTVIPEQGKHFTLSTQAFLADQILKDILGQAETRARQDLGLSPTAPPKFCYVGLYELLRLLTYLDEVDPVLVTLLAGSDRKFHYDSPKFVEAIIRLARGDIPHLAQSPIIRVDDDTTVNPKSIRKLIEKFVTVSKEQPFYFFSGRYRHSDDTNEHYDVINDYAVRTHWFFPKGTEFKDKRFYNSDPNFQARVQLAEKFLADLSVFGANQPSPISSNYAKNLHDRNYSDNLKKMIKAPTPILLLKTEFEEEQKRQPQVVSGAGLIMGRRNVELLPPFMNFRESVTWVDDHLKRRLHERIGDLTYVDPECLEDILFEQNRYPEGTTDKQTKDQDWYFERILEGCLLHAIIMDAETDSYSDLICDIVLFKKVSSDITQQIKDKMKDRLMEIAIKRYEAVLSCWSSDEFKGYDSYKWAKAELSSFKSSTHPPELCENLVKDAMDYIDLLLNWHKFTRVIERLRFLGNSWLFDQGFV